MQNEFTEINFNHRRTSDGSASTVARIRSIAESDQTNSWPTSLGFYVRRFSSDFQAFRLESTGAAVFQGPSSEFARIDSIGRLLVGTPTTYSQGGFTPSLQQHATSASGTGIYRWAGASSGAAILGFAKSRGASIGANVIVADNDHLGSITFSGDDGTDLNSQAASITAQVDGTPGANDMPGRLVFSTTADGASSPTERLRITSAGLVGIGTTTPASKLSVSDSSSVQIQATTGTVDFRIQSIDANSAAYSGTVSNHNYVFTTNNSERARIDTSGRLLVGTSTSIATAIQPYLQVQGTGEDAYTSTGRWSNDANGSGLIFNKSRGGAVGTLGAVTNGDVIGEISFYGDNGSTFNNAASIVAVIDGTISGGGANDMPGRLVFSTTADGASSPTERWRYSNNGETRISNMVEIFPVTDNACLLGRNSFRWSAVWAANGTIQTSDERTKTEITDAALGADFIKSLRPVSYRWVEGGKRPTGEFDEDNNYIYESVPGERTHWGFIAQEVKQAVDAADVDFGGWVLTDKDDPDSQQALRYDQFIAPLTKALQETMAELEALKAEVAALKAQ